MSIDTCADLEVSLRHRDSESYTVELRFNDPQNPVQQQPVWGSCSLDLTELLSKANDYETYGRLLSDALFADQAIRELFLTARAVVQQSQKSLRLRLFIDASTPELHKLRWETLVDPVDHQPFLTQPWVSFSRFLSENGWSNVKLRARSALSALVVVASPSDTTRFQSHGQPLASIHVDAEVERARCSLDPIPHIPLVSSAASPGNVTLRRLVEHLHQGCDILYLVCHGALSRKPEGMHETQDPYLLLEKEDGSGEMVSGQELVAEIRSLPADLRPRLIVLASCESGSGVTSDADGALAALGPKLAQVGIPAVLAMQGSVSMETVAQFMPVFFATLAKDGRVDQAVTAGRTAVRQQPDWWMPVLFMRLKDGQIWYVPSFLDRFGNTVEFGKWPSLTSSIRAGCCTPILGPGLIEPIIGSYSEIAQEWAQIFGYPLSERDRDSLPHVAQYLAVNQDRNTLFDRLIRALLKKITTRFADLPLGDANLERLPMGQSLEQIMDQAGQEISQNDPTEPHRILASLPLKYYITTNLNHWMVKALEEAGKHPVMEVLPWNEQLIEQWHDTSIFAREPTYRPSVERPLVYHLFGHFDMPESIVLTEDDYFEFLKGIAHINADKTQKFIPSFVQRAFSDSALLFLGYRMEDWNFRVLFRSILDQPGGRLSEYSHIAVQIMPEVGRLIAPDRALQYMEQYLSKGARAEIRLFLGSPKEFLTLLTQKLTEDR